MTPLEYFWHGLIVLGIILALTVIAVLLGGGEED